MNRTKPYKFDSHFSRDDFVFLLQHEFSNKRFWIEERRLNIVYLICFDTSLTKWGVLVDLSDLIQLFEWVAGGGVRTRFCL